MALPDTYLETINPTSKSSGSMKPSNGSSTGSTSISSSSYPPGDTNRNIAVDGVEYKWDTASASWTPA